MAKSSSVILVGMPGAGKSTLGILLAKELGMDFIDTDVAIQVRERKTLQQIMDDSNYLKLRHIEEQVLLETDCSNKVVATGGSAVYSEPGMNQLKSQGPVVFLDVPINELAHRIHNFEERGIARHANQSFDELFEERRDLYLKYADIQLDCSGLSAQQTLKKVIDALNANDP